MLQNASTQAEVKLSGCYATLCKVVVGFLIMIFACTLSATFLPTSPTRAEVDTGVDSGVNSGHEMVSPTATPTPIDTVIASP
jgi:hypothetical protein